MYQKKMVLLLTTMLMLTLLLPSLAWAGPFDLGSQFQQIAKESAIAELQQKLQEKGYYSGPIDGKTDSIKDNALDQVKDKAGVPREANDLKSMVEAKKNQLLEESKNKVFKEVAKKVQIEYLQANYPKNVTSGSSITAQLVVKNTSQMTWLKDGQFMSYFTYRWLDSSGKLVDQIPEGKIFLPHDIKPGQLLSFNIETLTPTNIGKYTLQVNLVMIDSPITKVMGMAPLNMPVDLVTTPGDNVPVITPDPVVDNGSPASGYLISGRGFGHGVGLSQWGARGMAIQGKKYTDIIKYYYTGTTVETLPSSNTTVRVGLWLGQNKATITAGGPYQIVDQETQNVLYSGQKGDRWQMQVVGGSVQATPLTGANSFSNVQLNQDFQASQTIQGRNLIFQPLSDGKLTLEEKKTTYRGNLKVSANLQGRLDVINSVNMEDYLFGVVTKESPSAWPIEALKTQAVVSRSYALFKIQSRASQSFDVYDSTTSQVYGGFNGESPQALEAVLSTAGQVVTYNGKPIEALFHANSGGYTESNENYWRGVAPVPYLRAVSDPYSGYQADPIGSRFGVWWQKSYSAAQIEKAFNANPANYIGQLISIDIVEKTSSGRPALIKVTGSAGSKTFSRSQFVNILDPNYVYFKSYWFDLTKQG